MVVKPYHGTPGDGNSSDGFDLTHCCPVVVRDTVLRCHPDGDAFYEFENFLARWSDISCTTRCDIYIRMFWFITYRHRAPPEEPSPPSSSSSRCSPLINQFNHSPARVKSEHKIAQNVRYIIWLWWPKALNKLYVWTVVLASRLYCHQQK